MTPSDDDSERSLQQRWGLSPRQARVAMFLAAGKSYKEIAQELGITFHTVNTHVKAVLKKAHAKSSRKLATLIHEGSRVDASGSDTSNSACDDTDDGTGEHP